MESVCRVVRYRKVPLQLFEEPGQQEVKSPDVLLKGEQYMGLTHWWLCSTEPTSSSHGAGAQQSCTPTELHMLCELQVALPHNYLCWPLRSNLLSCLHCRSSAFTKMWYLKLCDRAIGSCHFFSSQKATQSPSTCFLWKYLGSIVKSAFSFLFIMLKRLDQPGWASHSSQT